MVLRKIIGFGKSSYVISLPKKWLKNNDLDKGNYIEIDESDTSLNITVPNSQKKITEKVCDLNVSGIEIDAVKKLIISAYVAGADVINIKSDSLNFGQIKSIFRSLNGFDIRDSQDDGVSYVDMLDYSKVNVESMISRCELIIRHIFNLMDDVSTHTQVSTIKDRYEEINSVNYLINRIVSKTKGSDLAAMGIENSMQTSMLMCKFKHIAKNIYLTSKTVFDYNLSGSDNHAYKVHIGAMRDTFNDLIKSYHSKNFMLANEGFVQLKNTEILIYEELGTSRNMYLNKIHTGLILILFELKYLANLVMNVQIELKSSNSFK